MNDLGFYQVFELNVDFTERVREEITPLFETDEYVPDGDHTRHHETDNLSVWGNGHIPFEDCGPWTQKFIKLFDDRSSSTKRRRSSVPYSLMFDWRTVYYSCFPISHW